MTQELLNALVEATDLSPDEQETLVVMLALEGAIQHQQQEAAEQRWRVLMQQVREVLTRPQPPAI